MDKAVFWIAVLVFGVEPPPVPPVVGGVVIPPPVLVVDPPLPAVPGVLTPYFLNTPGLNSLVTTPPVLVPVPPPVVVGLLPPIDGVVNPRLPSNHSLLARDPQAVVRRVSLVP